MVGDSLSKALMLEKKVLFSCRVAFTGGKIWIITCMLFLFKPIIHFYWFIDSKNHVERYNKHYKEGFFRISCGAEASPTTTLSAINIKHSIPKMAWLFFMLHSLNYSSSSILHEIWGQKGKKWWLYLVQPHIFTLMHNWNLRRGLLWQIHFFRQRAINRENFDALNKFYCCIICPFRPASSQDCSSQTWK